MHRIGRYELIQRFAAGGMGELHLARIAGAEGFNKPIVLKRISPHLQTNPHYREFFIREAKVSAGLVHPNIAQVFDLGEDDDELYIVMEFVDGADLSTVLGYLTANRLPIPPEVLAVIMFDVLEALSFAHSYSTTPGAAGIVHRDVSPSNILLARQTGFAKLCDFGVMSIQGIETTQKFCTVGKVAYMAPEQARGEPVDPRADLFSVAAIMLLALTGNGPYGSGAFSEVLQRVRSGNTMGIDDLIQNTPAKLQGAIKRGLCVDPDERFGSASEFLDEIESYIFEADPRKARATLCELVNNALPSIPLVDDAAAGTLFKENPTKRWTRLVTRFDTTFSESGIGTGPSPPQTRAPRRWRWMIAALLIAGAGTYTLKDAMPGWLRPKLNTRRGELTRLPPAPMTRQPALRPTSSPRPRANRPEPRKRSTAKSYLNLNVIPWAHVSIDGVALQKTTPLKQHPLRPGSHEIEIRGPKGQHRSITVKLDAGESVTRIVRLE